MDPAPTPRRSGGLLSVLELCAMTLTAAVAIAAILLVALPLDRAASPGRIALLAVITFGGIVLGSELSERWEPTQGVRRAVLRGYAVAIPALLAVLVLVLVLP